jgi:hypothetical protein
MALVRGFAVDMCLSPSEFSVIAIGVCEIDSESVLVKLPA